MAYSSLNQEDKKYVVWYGEQQSWRPSHPMTQEHAELHAANLEREGYRTRIHPQLRITREDLVEG